VPCGSGSSERRREAIQNALEKTSAEIRELQSQLNGIVMNRDLILAQIQARINDAAKRVSLKRDMFQSKEREYTFAVMKLETATSNQRQIEKKWNLDMTSSADGDVVSLEVCPTRQQPISSAGEGQFS